ECPICSELGHGPLDCPMEQQEEDQPMMTSSIDLIPTGKYELGLCVNGSLMESWVCDFGTSEHMTFSLEAMFDFEPVSNPMITATGGEYTIEGFGTLSSVFVDGEGIEASVKLEHVAYLPRLLYNLCSMKAAAGRGHSLTTDAFGVKHVGGNLKFEPHKAFTAMNYRKKPQQSISLGAAVLTHVNSPGTTVDITLFHCAFGYSHEVVQRKTVARLLDAGREITLVGKLETCSGCALGKSIRKAVPIFTHNRGSSVDLDLSGRKPKSLGVSYYLMVVRDDFSRYTWVYPLRRKSEASEKFKLFLAENNLDTVPSAVLRVRSDDLGEFLEGSFGSLCREFRIAQEHTTVLTPHS
ncbi:unnamed protein product, partial [Discosporangium mesarthrocarpum]